MSDATIDVRVTTRAAHEEIAGFRDGVLAVRVTAPPVDGRANDAVCRLVARAAGVAPGRVTVVRGQRSRTKLLRIDGLTPAELRAALA
jgi:uncharacterized protein (TIGR00251 family)